MLDVYVIHSSQDDAIATRIHFALSAANIKNWVDHVHGSDQIEPLIRERRKNLLTCDTGIFILSPESIISAECTHEWSTMLKQGKRLVITIADGIPLDDLPDLLWDRSLPFIDLREKLDQGIQQLVQVVAGEIPQ